MNLSTQALAAFLAIVGCSHGVLPRYYERLVPPWLPAPRVLVLASGIVEIALGVGLLFPASRYAAALATVALFAVYVATHVDALVRSRSADRSGLDGTPAAVARRR